MLTNNRSKWISTFTLIILVFLITGCHSDNALRSRLGSFWGAPGNYMEFPEPDNLGSHSRTFAFGEKVGMVYTCRAGFIDLGHLREAADRTAYLSKIVYDNLMEENEEFSYKVIEPSRYWVTVKYPRYWQGLSPDEKQKIAELTSIKLGQYFAHRSMIWHEIITWYGFSSVGIFPEKISSFSWEDTYSDNLGTWLAVKALKQGRENFDKTMTRLINKKLFDLDVQPSETAKKAAKKIAGDWYTGSMYFFVNMKHQNFDVGYENGTIKPVLVPDICPDAIPKSLPVATLQSVNETGFEIGLELEPRIMEEGEIYREIDKNKEHHLVPDMHFPMIIERIKRNLHESVAILYGYNYADEKFSEKDEKNDI